MLTAEVFDLLSALVPRQYRDDLCFAKSGFLHDSKVKVFFYFRVGPYRGSLQTLKTPSPKLSTKAGQLHFATEDHLPGLIHSVSDVQIIIWCTKNGPNQLNERDDFVGGGYVTEVCVFRCSRPPNPVERDRVFRRERAILIGAKRGIWF